MSHSDKRGSRWRVAPDEGYLGQNAAVLRPHQSPAVTASPDRGKPSFGKLISMKGAGKRLYFREIYDKLYTAAEMLPMRRCAHKRRRLLLTGTWVPGMSESFLGISFLPGGLRAGRGGCTMTFEQVVLLLTLLGGAIYVTFQITWTVSHDDKKKK